MNVDNCKSRHPRQYKFFLLSGKCKFGEKCAYLHISGKDKNKEVENQIKLLITDVETLKKKNFELEQIILKLDSTVNELKYQKEDFKETFVCELCKW